MNLRPSLHFGSDERESTAGSFEYESLAIADPAVAALVNRERERQSTTLSLIASESPAPAAVHAALGSIFDDKTGEGYPGARYHRGCAVADELEELAISRAKALFGADHANVQVHSGVNANLAVYQAALNPGDRVVSMDLAHGGHLSHGAKASITGRIFSFRHYGVRADTEEIDLDEVRRVAREHRPRLIIAGGSSYPRLIDYASFRAIADALNTCGVRTRTGTPWRWEYTRNLIQRPGRSGYEGTVVSNGVGR